MPASSIDSYLQDARNNFDAVRPAPIFGDANLNQSTLQNVHISTNCYHGFHDLKRSETDRNHVDDDCEMLDAPVIDRPLHTTSRKRSADSQDNPQRKRLRNELLKVQRERSNEPETNEKMKLDTNKEDFVESLYWHIHGGNIFHLIQYDSSMCSLVGTRSSPSHSASALKTNIPTFYMLLFKYRFTLRI